MNKLVRKKIKISGIVQGVGFRPFVWKRANAAGLTGWVHNDSSGVTIEVQGSPSQIEEFISGFSDKLPPLARIDLLDCLDVATVQESSFEILKSSASAEQSTPISPEISVCTDCLNEFSDPADRRYRYPFINCTNCGPRFTIVEDIPYDRPLTTMKSFPMCNVCQREYDDPSNRRFHAQPNACPDCGPRVWFVESSDDDESFLSSKTLSSNEEALLKFKTAIENGKIVAVKGIGGFHLAVDAANENAIATLRVRKGRVDKPFAIMVHDIRQARSLAMVSDEERQLLESKERPVVLLQKKAADESEDSIAPNIAPGNDFVGCLLPYSPLHYLLAQSGPLVMTSGNLSDEPIVRTNLECRQRLAGIADNFLLHDRDIEVVCDDSVVRCIDNELLPIRRSRGYAPMPVRLSECGASVLAVGGEIKSAFCVTRDDHAFLSQHIGDMGNIETLDALKRSVEHFLRLFRIEVDAISADRHPGYLSGIWASEFAHTLGVPLIRVQHHFAHIASLLAEHQLPPRQQIIGCCFDGTGYGIDETIWGSEFMIASQSGFDRIAHLSYSPLPGGDSSIRRPYRIALSQLWANQIEWDDHLPCVKCCSDNERKLLRQQLGNDLNCVPTSSMGRMFDTVASLIGIRHETNYEAQAAMEMEARAASEINNVDPFAWNFKFNVAENPMQITANQLLQDLCDDVIAGVDIASMAGKFHHAVANMIAEVCVAARDRFKINTVGLTGGVFQNVLLLQLARQQLNENDFEVLTHSVVPPNDGGISLGQAVVARKQLADANGF